ncbi:hypothetical protein SAMN05444920_119114 [Nonomuraea solani]|uniref:Uncharacterized protein n=1 Tax=Nonomuraea solani TaxID=1144553 RepID=A0A1H6EWY2_9ACTN|nr:hypothetical protein [Nonomuraea solani]SEH01184.1 hypothetical protein SAMN05444920_119114 [Nonomuraea solani]
MPERANAVLDAAGSSASRARLFGLYLPREFQPLYDTDDARYLLGLPNQFDLLSPYWPGWSASAAAAPGG